MISTAHQVYKTDSGKQVISSLQTRLSFVLKAVCLLFLLQSCNTSRFLDKEKGEIFLVENKIVFENKTRNKANLGYEMESLFQQTPNSRFFGIPRQHFYFIAQDTFERSNLGKSFYRFLSRRLAEEPVYLDTALVQKTRDDMQLYLQNRGYFFADVDKKIKTNKKKTKARVNYLVNTGNRFFTDTLIYKSKDSVIQQILYDISDESFFKTGKPIDIKLYDSEVERITSHLRNNGYFYFYPQYISNLESPDSSNTEYTAVLELEILTPPEQDAHQKFSIGEIYVDADFDPSVPYTTLPDTLIDKIHFLYRSKNFNIKPQTLGSSITFRTGEIYDQSEVENTKRQLSALGVFSPPIVRYTEDSLQSNVLNIEILLRPNKKWQLGLDLDISNTQRNNFVTNQNLIGLTFSPSLRNRNFRKGAELLILNTDFGIELAPLRDGSPIINSLDFRLQGDIYFPRFVDYFKIWRGLNNMSFVGDGFYNKIRKKANSRFSSSYNLLILLNNYQLQFFNVGFGYDVPLSTGELLNINHFGIDLLVPQIVENSRFDTLLNTNPFLENSFSSQFITGFLFRDVNYTFTNSSKRNDSYYFFRGYFDVSGLEVMGVNALFNAVSGKSTQFSLGQADFSQYIKLEADGRHYWKYGGNRLLVSRFNVGVAQPFYKSTTVPYVKQFYVGGPNSIRGWYARGLGPGLYRDTLVDDPTARNLFYQSGDFKLEFNLEYRFLMLRPFGLFNMYGATYIDAGNIWTLKKEEERPGSHLTLKRVYSESTDEIIADNFLRQIAISAGFGTRWDFTYFIFRLDLGTPVRNNYPDIQRNNSYWVDFSKWQMKDIVFNIGLGYPF